MSKDEYSWMARDATETERLNFQHLTLVETMGYLLHPNISLGPDARVADIATGTGVILTDLAKSHPSTCQFDGFDITDVQFPPADKLPNNVKLHVADVREPLPFEYHGKYDVVIIRYINAGMRPGDWKTVARNVCELLKPSGWLQWIEGDFYQACNWVKLDPFQVSTGCAQEVSDLIGPAKEAFRYFTANLAAILREAGLSNAIQEITSTDRIPGSRPV